MTRTEFYQLFVANLQKELVEGSDDAKLNIQRYLRQATSVLAQAIIDVQECDKLNDKNALFLLRNKYDSIENLKNLLNGAVISLLELAKIEVVGQISKLEVKNED